MPGEVAFWPEYDEPDDEDWRWLPMAATRKRGAAKESGPPGPYEPPTLVRADRDLFVVDNGGHRLFRTGEQIPAELAQLPQVDATFADGVWVPAT